MTTQSRFLPANDFRTLQTQLHRLFEPLSRMTAATDEDLVTGTWAPPVDVAETLDGIMVRAEVPGMKQDDIAIEFENGMLTIGGERKIEKATEGMTDHRVERADGNFSRSFTLPRTVDAERITASYRDGIIEIDIPKKEDAKPKQIRIGIDK